jgi:SAM-dependent methyltransferase
MVLSAKTDSYWNEVARALKGQRGQALWRAHSDAVNNRLVARWPPATQCECLLKTDLFDEALGNGLYSLMVSRAQRVVGMDVSIRALQTALSRHYSLQAVCSDARRLPFADGSFDVIISISTLDHFVTKDEILVSLQEFRRALQPGGRLILTLDNLANPLMALRQLLPFRLLYRLGAVPYYVGATYGPGGLQRVMENVGFEVCAMTAIMHCPRVLAVALARVMDGFVSLETQRRFLDSLMAFERLARWPTRFLTGHFIAVNALKH